LPLEHIDGALHVKYVCFFVCPLLCCCASTRCRLPLSDRYEDADGEDLNEEEMKRFAQTYKLLADRWVESGRGETRRLACLACDEREMPSSEALCCVPAVVCSHIGSGKIQFGRPGRQHQHQRSRKVAATLTTTNTNHPRGRYKQTPTSPPPAPTLTTTTTHRQH